MGQVSEVSLLQELFEFLPTGVLVADDHAVYVLANRAARALLGRRADEVVGRHLSEIVAPGRRAEVDVQWRAFLRDGAQSGVFAVHAPDGRERLVYFDARAHVTPGRHCSFLSSVTATRAGIEPSRIASEGASEAPLSETAEGAPVSSESTTDGTRWLTLCAWTKCVQVGDRWVTIEGYLLDHHGITVTHGICPAAFEAASAEDEPPRSNR